MRSIKNNPQDSLDLSFGQMLTVSFKELDHMLSLSNPHFTANHYRYVVYHSLKHLEDVLSAHEDYNLEVEGSKAQYLENLFMFFQSIYQAGKQTPDQLGAFLSDQFYYLTGQVEEDAEEGIQQYYDLALSLAVENTCNNLQRSKAEITTEEQLTSIYHQKHVEFWKKLKELHSAKWFHQKKFTGMLD